ncbi:hypothetical protein [Streptomyces tsukubensis]|uniref:Lipoprotein n=1 Tax=Streptomyces tsukubensis TaxID=83656 RepID=A0A1V4A573_9ACTN|nr:hypothetical protein B1H18_21170 [Streptomyces tsukubensis]QFR96025.1 hypothetical protein GBW32_26970 [Streptomyces tsukubensis]
MPITSPARYRSGPRRRSLFISAAGLAGAAVLSGCSDESGGLAGTSDTARADAVELRLSRAEARDSRSLAQRYDAVLTAHPTLAARLRPMRAEVVAHAAAFSGAAPSGSPTVTPSGSTADTHVGTPDGAPSNEKEALRSLASAERTLADRRGKTLLHAPDELARLLASVAAAGAAHAYLLTEDGA